MTHTSSTMTQRPTKKTIYFFIWQQHKKSLILVLLIIYKNGNRRGSRGDNVTSQIGIVNQVHSYGGYFSAIFFCFSPSFDLARGIFLLMYKHIEMSTWLDPQYRLGKKLEWDAFAILLAIALSLFLCLISQGRAMPAFCISVSQANRFFFPLFLFILSNLMEKK